MLILINLVFGFASGGRIDNAAHIGGLVAGLWLGALIVPSGVPTLSSLWNRPSGTPLNAAAAARPASSPAYMSVLGIGVVAVVVAAGIAIGTADRRTGDALPANGGTATVVLDLSAPEGSSAAPR
jgi:hypothetical protein